MTRLRAVTAAAVRAIVWLTLVVGRAIARTWSRIHEPRVSKVIYLVGYLIAVAIGVVTLWRPPTSIETPLGPTLTTLWGAAILVGAIAAAVAVLPGWWWLERLGIYSVAVGALIYFGVVLTLHAQGPAGSSRLTQAGMILGFAWLISANRLWEIRGYTFEPRGR
ncbi:MAG: hypothetical protein PIR02_15895 [Microbacterium enclense]